jgi:hypothetical protein
MVASSFDRELNRGNCPVSSSAALGLSDFYSEKTSAQQ